MKMKMKMKIKIKMKRKRKMKRRAGRERAEVRNSPESPSSGSPVFMWA
ncbi:hypothetical protein [Cohnella fermenti]|nr:hypothetical protein [Cohnella fermenti]